MNPVALDPTAAIGYGDPVPWAGFVHCAERAGLGVGR